MQADSIDQLAITVARGASRRKLLAAMLGAIGAGALSRFEAAAGSSCATSADCSAGMVCDQGFCAFPACYPPGSACSSHDDCCDDYLCISGSCTASVRCVALGGGCGGSGQCCPGLVCSDGVCGPEPTPVPEGNGGGNQGGGGNSSGGGGGGGGGTTTGGELVLQLPSTGQDPAGHQTGRWAALAGLAAGLAGLIRLTNNRSVDQGNSRD